MREASEMAVTSPPVPQVPIWSIEAVLTVLRAGPLPHPNTARPFSPTASSSRVKTLAI
jgi:hypothetical protein